MEGEKQEQSQEAKQPQQTRWEFAQWIFGAIYSPRETFHEIIESPDIKGVLLLLILVLSFSVGALYVSGSRFLVVTATPENDDWTDSQSQLLWSSNGNLQFDSNDAVIGNTSVVSPISGGSAIWLNLTSIGEFNCTAGNFEVLGFYIKWTHSSNTTPNTALVSLFSGANSRFELNITDFLSTSNNQWDSLMIDVGSKNDKFKETNSPNWGNITSVGFLLTWEDPANITLKLDGIYFGKYVFLATTGFFESWISSFSILTVFDFFLKWLLFSAGLWLVLRGYADQKSSFRNLFYISGYCFSGLIIYVLIRFFSFLVIPPTHSFDALASYLLFGTIFVFNLWPIILGTFALKQIHDFSGKRAFLLSVSGYFVYVFVAVMLLFGISLQRVLFALP